MITSWLQDFVLAMSPTQYGILAAGLALLMATLGAYCLGRLRLLRVIEDTPTSRVRSAAQGYVELEGKVEFPRSPPLTSPLRGVPCAWWSYRIEDLDPAREAEPAPWDGLAALWALVLNLFGARGAGRLVEAGRSHECFLIRDESGACVVDPDQAHIVGVPSTVWTVGSQRLEESVIRVDQSLYALGLFQTPHEHALASERREAGELISTWQLDRLKLAQRFDANRDGRIDAVEWETAWQAAIAEVRRRREERGPVPDLHVLCDPADRRPFLLSVLGQPRLAGRVWFECVTSLLACAMVATLLLGSLGARGLL